MSGISNYLTKKLLDHALRGDISDTDYEQPATVYLALHQSAPDDEGVGGELSGGGYARQVIGFAEADEENGYITNATSPVFSPPTCTITHFSIWDAATSGNCLFTGSVGVPQSVTGGDTYSPLNGALRINKIAG